MELRVNDYVRTKNDGIRKILDIGEYLGMKQYLIDEDGDYVIDNSIIKSSPNIIDLIEPLDLLYIDIEYGFAGGLVVPRIYETQAELDEAIEKIKNDEERELVGIVTHEQLKNMEYKIGE